MALLSKPNRKLDIFSLLLTFGDIFMNWSLNPVDFDVVREILITELISKSYQSMWQVVKFACYTTKQEVLLHCVCSTLPRSLITAPALNASICNIQL